MPKGLPDSMTYTMSKRIMRIARDKSAERYNKRQSDFEAVGDFLVMFLQGIGYLLFGALWVLGSPLIFINYLSKRAEARESGEERKARYERAKAKHAQKVS